MASPTNARLLSVLTACPASAANGLEFRGEVQLDCTPCFNCTHPNAFYTRRAIFRLQLHQLPGITKTLQSHNASVVLQPEYEIFKRLAAPSRKCRKSWTSCKCHYSKMQTNHVPALEPQKTTTIQKQKKKQNVAKTMYCLIVPRQCEIHGVSCFKCLPLSRMSCVGAYCTIVPAQVLSSRRLCARASCKAKVTILPPKSPTDAQCAPRGMFHHFMTILS